MQKETKDIFEFLSSITDFFDDGNYKPNKKINIDDSIRKTNECYYIFDLQTSKIVEYSGFDKLLGYTKENITLDFIYSLFTPNDKDIITRITKSSILYCLSRSRICEDAVLQLSHRIRKIDGSYIKVVNTSKPYKINKDGYLTHFIVNYIDIDFLNSNEYISCFFSAKDLDRKAFRKEVFKAYSDFFTDREVDIIKAINEGLTNSEIAEKLFISKHTVVTHRKNILKKSNQNNSEGLLLFCKERGII